MAGFIKLDRDITSHPLWIARPFSKGQAWVDLLLQAAWKSHTDAYGRLQRRGTVHTSRIKLAHRWGWTTKAVDRFLSVLKVSTMVSIQTSTVPSTGGTFITICNYDLYQNSKTDDVHSGVHSTDISHVHSSGTVGEQSGNSRAHNRRRERREEGKKGKKTDTSQPNGWALWIDVNRSVGRPDPIAVGRDTQASKHIMEALKGNADEFKRICTAYLTDTDPWIVERGHALHVLTSKINRYALNGPIMADDSFFSAADAAAEALCNKMRKGTA